MRNTLVSGLLALALSTSTVGRQQAPAERDWETEILPKLREMLKVPPTAEFKRVKSKSLPDADPLKLFVGPVEDPEVRSILSEWVGKWNKEKARKYGAIEVVSDPALADVSIHNFTRPSRLLSPKLTGKYQVVAVDGALLVRKPPDVEVWASWTGTMLAGEYKVAAGAITEQIEKRMKERAKEKRK